MFGMGGSEIIVILIVALLFLGPDKLPQAAKSISKGIRDIKKQSRALQNQIESDEQIGGAIRDLKSALRGEELPVHPKPMKTPALPEGEPGPPTAADHAADDAVAAAESAAAAPAEPAALPEPEPARLTLPPTAGESDAEARDDSGDRDELAAMIRPAPGTVAKGR